MLSKSNLRLDQFLTNLNYLEINHKDYEDFHEIDLLLLMMVEGNLFLRNYVMKQIELMTKLMVENEDVVDDDVHENDFLFELDL